MIDPLETPPEVPANDPQVVSSLFAQSFHRLHSTLLLRGYRCTKGEQDGGRERSFSYVNSRTRTTVTLRYIRQRRGGYYCQRVTVNGKLYKLAEVLGVISA